MASFYLILGVTNYFDVKDKDCIAMMEVGAFFWIITLPVAIVVFVLWLMIDNSIDCGKKIRERIKKS
jgi:hypothetical protein